MHKKPDILPYNSPEGSIVEYIEKSSVFVIVENLRKKSEREFLIVKGLPGYLRLPYEGVE